MDTPASHTSPTARAKNGDSTLRDHWFAGASLLERRDSNRRSSLHPFHLERSGSHQVSARSFPNIKSAKSFPDNSSASAELKNGRTSRPFAGAKRPKETGGSNPFVPPTIDVRTSLPGSPDLCQIASLDDDA